MITMTCDQKFWDILEESIRKNRKLLELLKDADPFEWLEKNKEERGVNDETDDGKD